MPGVTEDARIPLQISRNCIVASVQLDLRPDVLASLRTDLLDLLGKSGAQAVVIDLSGLQTIDREEFEALRRTSDMARLMGARSVLSGLNPGVVSSLVDLDVNLKYTLAPCIINPGTLKCGFMFIGPVSSIVTNWQKRKLRNLSGKRSGNLYHLQRYLIPF